jgi:predicted acetyltransferase
MSSAPHLAQLELTYATREGTEDFLRATARGFHQDYDPERAGPARGVFEPERNFGYTVAGRWVATCGAYTRRMTVPGGSVPVAAVSYVTVQPSYRRRGLLSQMMRHQLGSLVEAGVEPVALLWASEAGIYGRYGYGAATAELSLTGPTQEAAFRPEVDLGPGSVGEVGAEEFRGVAEALHARLLAARPGALDRPGGWWDAVLDDHPARRNGESGYRFALHFDASGRPDGYLSFRTGERAGGGWGPGGSVRVVSLDAATASGYARLWRFVLDLDLIRSFQAHRGPDEPLLHLLANPRAVTSTVSDGTYVRLVDLPRALEARRYAADLDLVLGVRDTLLPQNAGSFRLQAGRDGAEVRRVSAEADVELDVRELGAGYLGGTSFAALHRAGLLTERTPGAVTALAAAFASPQAPYCPDNF